MPKDLDLYIDEIEWPRVYIQLSHEELIEDMRRFREELSQSPEKAQAFLQKIGVIGEDGEVRHLIPD